jgi:hypothetical protein
MGTKIQKATQKFCAHFISNVYYTCSTLLEKPTPNNMNTFKLRFLRISGICAIFALSLETAANADVLASWDVWNGAEDGVKPLAQSTRIRRSPASAHLLARHVDPAFATIGGGH